MRIPKYWAKETYSGQDRNGKSKSFSAWGWSFETFATAKQMAAVKAKKIWNRIVTYDEKVDSYQYLEQPLREEILQTERRGDEAFAVITRNRYGALVLNSSSVCFADVDFPKVVPNGFADSLLLLFSSKRKAARVKKAENETLEPVRQWAARNPGRSFRLYRTAAGLRLLFTDRLYNPTSAEIKKLLEELGSDQLYRKLTFRQECFRARLTPKPWRCGCNLPPNRYPWDNPAEEKKYREWQKKYEDCSESFGICRLPEVFGAAPKDEQITAIVKLHDRFACCNPDSELA